MFAQATTEDFQQVCEDVSGEDLDFFFEQWVYDEYYPSYHYNFENKNDTIDFVIWQQQELQGRRPLFIMPVEVNLQFASGGDTTIRVWNNEIYQVYSIPVDEMVDMITIDPDKKILCTKTLDPAIPVNLTENKTEFEALIQIYPNPIHAGATIEISAATKDMVLSFYDIAGKEVMRMDHLQPGAIDFKRGNLPGGVYLFNLQSKLGQSIASGKVIIN